MYMDTARKGLPLHNFWNNIHFHPTDAVEDPWGRRILDKCAEDKAVDSVRIYSMFEDIIYVGENGEICYDTMGSKILDILCFRLKAYDERTSYRSMLASRMERMQY